MVTGPAFSCCTVGPVLMSNVLTLQGDVAQLLTAYKEAVLRYEALALAVTARASAAAAAAVAAAAPALLAQVPNAVPPPPPPEQHTAPQPTLLPPPMPPPAVAVHSGAHAGIVQPPTAQPPEAPVTSGIPADMPTSPQQPAVPAASEQQQPSAPAPADEPASLVVDNPVAAVPGVAANGPSLATEMPPAVTSAGPSLTEDRGLSEYPVLPAGDDGAAVETKQPDDAAESSQFIAVSAPPAAPILEDHPAAAASSPAAGGLASSDPAPEQSSAQAEPADSVRSMDGSAAEAEAAGSALERGREDDLTAAAAALPEAAADEEAELAGPSSLTSKRRLPVAVCHCDRLDGFSTGTICSSFSDVTCCDMQPWRRSWQRSAPRLLRQTQLLKKKTALRRMSRASPQRLLLTRQSMQRRQSLIWPSLPQPQVWQMPMLQPNLRAAAGRNRRPQKHCCLTCRPLSLSSQGSPAAATAPAPMQAPHRKVWKQLPGRTVPTCSLGWTWRHPAARVPTARQRRGSSGHRASCSRQERRASTLQKTTMKSRLGTH